MADRKNKGSVQASQDGGDNQRQEMVHQDTIDFPAWFGYGSQTRIQMDDWNVSTYLQPNCQLASNWVSINQNRIRFFVLH